MNLVTIIIRYYWHSKKKWNYNVLKDYGDVNVGSCLV